VLETTVQGKCLGAGFRQLFVQVGEAAGVLGFSG
jgi:hypothetical protein